MLTRRGFLSGATAALAAGAVAFRDDSLDRIDNLVIRGGGEPDDEDFWMQVRAAFALDPNFVNLNNGGCSPSPRIVQEAVKRQMDYSNQAPSFYMWQQVQPEIEAVRRRLAKSFAVDPEEIAITRNASESLEICLFGFDLQPGDEIVASRLDYPRMLTTLNTRVRREGVKVVSVPSPIPTSSRDNVRQHLLEGYKNAITDRTRLILVSQVSFMNGQIFPIREICAMAKAKGIPVVVDGAHAFVQYEFDQGDLGCEYYGASLHKWLMAPMGTGMLYVKKDKIADLWPLMACNPEQDKDIRKYEEIGTHPAAIPNGIGEALTFHEMLGITRKEARYRYLRRRWSEPIRDNPKFRWYTSLNQAESCALTTVGIEGIKTADLHKWLFEKKGLYMTSIVNDFIDGLRITPNVYTTVSEVDRLRDALLQAAKTGIEA